MTYKATAIRGAIKGVMEGRLGTVRTCPDGMFKYGVFDGQPLIATQALAIDIRFHHRFDIVFGPLRRHESTPVSTQSSFRMSRLAIEIPIWTTLATTVQLEARDAQRSLVAADASTAMEALTRPNALTVDNLGVPTGIVSGLLSGDGDAYPEWGITSEDWTLGLLKSRITATAIVVISQATG